LFSYLCSSVFICGSFFLFGCETKDQQEVVLYTSVDEPIARPIVDAFQKQTGIKIRLVSDTEASKSVGLAERLRAEKSNPRCDVWWSNEIFLTINLANEGLLAKYESPGDSEIPRQFRDPEHRFTCNGLRARMIVTADGREPLTRIEQLIDPSLKGKIAIARPTAGTTGGQVAALYSLWGDAKADEFFTKLHANDCKLLGGNSVVAESVGNGTILAGLTDNDDAAAAQREGGKLVAKPLDQDNSMGTLAIPTSIALVSGSKNEVAAKKLIDYLASKQVEQKLIEANFIGWSIRATGPPPFKMMSIDYRAAANIMPKAVRRATAILEGRE